LRVFELIFCLETMGLELLHSKMPCLIDITQSVFSMHFFLILHLWLPGNALFDMPMVVRLLHLDNEADRKSRFPKRWFPSTKMQRRFNKLLNDMALILSICFQVSLFGQGLIDCLWILE